jgi:hypothetical protein
MALPYGEMLNRRVRLLELGEVSSPLMAEMHVFPFRPNKNKEVGLFWTNNIDSLLKKEEVGSFWTNEIPSLIKKEVVLFWANESGLCGYTNLR